MPLLKKIRTWGQSPRKLLLVERGRHYQRATSREERKGGTPKSYSSWSERKGFSSWRERREGSARQLLLVERDEDAVPEGSSPRRETRRQCQKSTPRGIAGDVLVKSVSLLENLYQLSNVICWSFLKSYVCNSNFKAIKYIY